MTHGEAQMLLLYYVPFAKGDVEQKEARNSAAKTLLCALAKVLKEAGREDAGAVEAMPPNSVDFHMEEQKVIAYISLPSAFAGKLLDLRVLDVAKEKVSVRRCFPDFQVFVSRMPESVSCEEAKGYFERSFGAVEKLEFVEVQPQNPSFKPEAKATPFKHCYLKFSQGDAAERCLKAKRHTLGSGAEIRVARAYRLGEWEETDRKLWIKATPECKDGEIERFEDLLNAELSKFGQLRERVRVEITPKSHKIIATFVNAQDSQRALKELKDKHLQSFKLVVRPFVKTNNFRLFLGNVRADVNEEAIVKAFAKYGKLIDVSLNNLRTPGLAGAVLSFEEESDYKTALTDAPDDVDVAQICAKKPYLTIHMESKDRNEFKEFMSKSKRPARGPYAYGPHAQLDRGAEGAPGMAGMAGMAGMGGMPGFMPPMAFGFPGMGGGMGMGVGAGMGAGMGMGVGAGMGAGMGMGMSSMPGQMQPPMQGQMQPPMQGPPPMGKPMGSFGGATAGQPGMYVPKQKNPKPVPL